MSYNHINVDNHAKNLAPFTVQPRGKAPGTDGGMTPIYEKKDGTVVVAMQSIDKGTKERKYLLAVVCADGGPSPIYEFPPSKLRTSKGLEVLENLEGICNSDIELIYKELIASRDKLNAQHMGAGKCPLLLAHQLLTEHVLGYKEPERVEVKDGYGCIEATCLQEVISKLELGYTVLELEKNFKVWGLLKCSDKAGHYYTYKIKNKYYFTFKLADIDSTEGGSEV